MDNREKKGFPGSSKDWSWGSVYMYFHVWRGEDTEIEVIMSAESQMLQDTHSLREDDVEKDGMGTGGGNYLVKMR